MRFTETPDWLMLPPDSRIQRVARQEGLNELVQDDVDFVLDLLCRDAGEPMEIINPHSYSAASPMRYVVLEGFKLNTMPGSDPLRRAVRVLKMARLIEKHAVHLTASLCRANVEFDSFELMLLLLNMAVDTATQMDSRGLALMLLLAGGEEPGNLDMRLAVELAVQRVDLKEMLRIARQLDQMAEFRSPKGPFHPDPNGEDVAVRGIRGLSEIARVNPSQWVMPRPLLLHRAISGELTVREPVTRRDQKQLLYLLVDATGSMEGGPAGRAAGVVVNALERVIKGDAEVYLRFFDTKLIGKEHHAGSPEEARALLAEVTRPDAYLSQATDFTAPLQDGSKRVEALVKSGALRDPEIIMVTDGQAPVPTIDTLGGAKLHTVQVGRTIVVSLANLARKSGGVNIDATGT